MLLVMGLVVEGPDWDTACYEGNSRDDIPLFAGRHCCTQNGL